jgi:hypothetical protein
MVAPEPLTAVLPARPSVRVRMALRVVPLQDDDPCGDAACHFELPAGSGVSGHLLAIIDGLGHGAEAAAAADAARAVLGAQPGLALPALMGALDASLAGTRGAAVGLLRLEGQRAWHAGVGNTRALRWRGDKMLRLSSQYGIVGGGLRGAVTVTEIDLQPGDWLLLFTDGLDEMLSLPAHLPEWDRDPALLCDHLLAHARAGRDDAGVLVCRVEGS